MPDTISAEEYKEQFGREGFLAPVMDIIAHNNRVVHADWFEFTNIIGDTESNKRISALCNRYGVLRARATGGQATNGSRHPSPS
jgi:hypothetical protein